jgi:hypothetical protein
MGLPILTDVSSGGLLPMVLIHIALSISLMKHALWRAMALFTHGSSISQRSMSTMSERPEEEEGSYIFFPGAAKYSIEEIRNSLPPSIYLPEKAVANGSNANANTVRDLMLDLIDKECTVCLYGFERGQEIRVLVDCKHVFHRLCLDQWLLHCHTTCPLCRLSLLPCDRSNEKKKKQN